MTENKQTFAKVNKDTVQKVLQAAGLRPVTLTENDDHSFTASFDKLPSPIVKEDVIKAHPNLVIVKRDADAPAARKPNVEPELNSLIHFGFTKPLDD